MKMMYPNPAKRTDQRQSGRKPVHTVRAIDILVFTIIIEYYCNSPDEIKQLYVQKKNTVRINYTTRDKINVCISMLA